jgi:hypothetical protein
MKKIIALSLIAAASLSLAACSTVPAVSTYADSLYRVADIMGAEAVRLGRLSPEQFADWKARAQGVLLLIHAGQATAEQLAPLVDEMRAAKR